MEDYRKLLYSKYNSTLYGFGNNNDGDIDSGQYKEFLDFLPTNKSSAVLDIGCGMGHFLRFLKNQGFSNIQGVDHSEEQVNCCKSSSLPVVFITDTYKFLETRIDTYDLIVMNDVLEHFQKNEVIRILLCCKSALRKDGNLVLRVPNMSSIYGLHGRYIDFTHEVGFTESSLKQVLLAVGFENISITDNKAPFGLRPKRFARWLLFKLWHKLFGFILLIEVGVDKPRLLGKTLISKATKGQ
jgi:2-polyprenyl-3-methyl-5-hydroxy-6-metoxy-1,4-benzoquinol methylase